MKIKRISLHRQDWKDGEPLTGVIELEGDGGKVELTLSPEQVQTIIRSCLEAMAQQVAKVSSSFYDEIAAESAVPVQEHMNTPIEFNPIKDIASDDDIPF